MRRLEKILAGIALIALVMKFANVPGNSVLAILSMMVLAIIYYTLSFALFNGVGFRAIFRKNSFSGISTPRILIAAVTGSALATLTVGILFKVQFWPFARLSLLLGLVILSIMLIIMILMRAKTGRAFYFPILIRALVIGSIGFVACLISNLAMVKLKYRYHPDYIKAYELY